MSDFNINVNKGEGIGQDKLDAFCDTLNLTFSLNLTYVTQITTNQQLTIFNKHTSFLSVH